MPDNIITDVNSRALADALRAVIPHANTDTKLLDSSVLLTEVEHGLAAVATDHYTIACYRLPEPSIGSFAVRVSLAQAKLLERWLRTLARTMTVKLASKNDVLTASHVLGGANGQLACTDLGAEHFPPWSQLIQDALTNPPDLADLAVVESVNAANLAKFLKAVEKPYTLNIQRGRRNKPFVVQAPNFIGLMMPIRFEGYELPRAWPADEVEAMAS